MSRLLQSSFIFFFSRRTYNRLSMAIRDNTTTFHLISIISIKDSIQVLLLKHSNWYVCLVNHANIVEGPTESFFWYHRNISTSFFFFLWNVIINSKVMLIKKNQHKRCLISLEKKKTSSRAERIHYIITKYKFL